MNWRERVGVLMRWGDYRGVDRYLEEVLADAKDTAERAFVLRARGDLLADVFLRRVEAAALFLKSYELDSSQPDALRRARFIQRSLGMLPQVAQSLERELGTTNEPVLAADMLVELGDTLQDLAQLERAAAAYRNALELTPASDGAMGALEDLEADDGTAQARMMALAQQGASGVGHGALTMLVRAARIARRLGDASQRPFLEAALRAVPTSAEAGALVDSWYASQGDFDGLRDFHHRFVDAIADPVQRSHVAVEAAARWLNRFQDPDVAASLLSLAIEACPEEVAAHVALAAYWEGKGDVRQALDRVDAALAAHGASGDDEEASAAEIFLLSEATEMAWRHLHDPQRAGRYAMRLKQKAPDHPGVEQFLRELEGEGEAPEARGDAEALVSDDDYESGSDSAASGDEPAAPVRELSDAERAELSEIDGKLAEYEQKNRWSDYIRTLVRKAELVADPAERIDLYSQAGTLYIERSSNQAEAIKCFEAVLEIDRYNIEAITRLKEMYEKRRDWEHLIGVMQSEAELLDPDDRPLRYMEMAQLATERLRKPDVCIDLWQKVLDFDPENPDALAALSQLYERAREWVPLAKVLEKHVETLRDEKELKAQLQKLGMIYADKIGDDEGAVHAFQRLLTLDPNDRRAQEQLKRRYASLKAWDDLEQFYATTEKWDELIRILEREADATETSTEDKIDLLFRVARLWETQQGKPERAARAYEKILDTDPDNLRAAEALSPIYENANDPRKLVNVYEVRLKHIDDPLAKIQLLRETGLLYEERLRDAATAFERYLEAFGTDPSQEVVREDVERLAGNVEGGWDRVVRAYGDAIAASADEYQVVELRMGLGRTLTAVGKIDEAIEQYHAVYEAQNDHPEAIAALAELYRQTQQFRELLGIHERRMELETDPDARRALAYQVAALWENELGDPDRAIDSYRGILEEYGDDEVDAYAALDRLYEQQERWNDFAATIERRIDLGPSSHEELAALKFRLARTLELHLADKLRAVELYREVLTIFPEHDGGRAALENLLDDAEVGAQAAEMLEPIYEVRGEWESSIRALTVLHARSDDPMRRLDLLTKVGEVYGERIGDSAKSFDAFCEALRDAPDSEDTLSRLEVLAVEQEKFPTLVQLVGELAAGTTDPGLARQLWLKAAQIYDLQLGDVDGAVARVSAHPRPRPR